MGTPNLPRCSRQCSIKNLFDKFSIFDDKLEDLDSYTTSAVKGIVFIFGRPDVVVLTLAPLGVPHDLVREGPADVLYAGPAGVLRKGNVRFFASPSCDLTDDNSSCAS